MSEFETVKVPFQRFGNHSVLTEKQRHEDPMVAEFIELFRNSFVYHPNLEMYELRCED